MASISTRMGRSKVFENWQYSSVDLWGIKTMQMPGMCEVPFSLPSVDYFCWEQHWSPKMVGAVFFISPLLV